MRLSQWIPEWGWWEWIQVTLFAAVLLLALIAGLVCGGAMTTGDINVKVDEEFVIELKGNPTTGYTWVWKASEMDDGAVVLLESWYEAPATDLVGAGGTFKYRFEAVGEGRVTMMFAYAREWEGVQPTDESRIFKVDIR